MLFIPNILWVKFGNPNDAFNQAKENKILLTLERLGQMSTTISALVVQDTTPVFSRTIWLTTSLIAMALYEISWIRYFLGRRTVRNLYRSLWVIPIPLATLPVLAFLLLAIYQNNILLILSVVVLGIGHVGIHLQHRKQMRIDGGHSPGLTVNDCC